MGSKKSMSFILGEIYDYIPTSYAASLGDEPGVVQITSQDSVSFRVRILEGIDNYSHGKPDVEVNVQKGSSFSEGLHLSKPSVIDSGLSFDDVFEGASI